MPVPDTRPYRRAGPTLASTLYGSARRDTPTRPKPRSVSLYEKSVIANTRAPSNADRSRHAEKQVTTVLHAVRDVHAFRDVADPLLGDHLQTTGVADYYTCDIRLLETESSAEDVGTNSNTVAAGKSAVRVTVVATSNTVAYVDAWCADMTQQDTFQQVYLLDDVKAS